MSITSTNALPLGTRNRFGTAAPKEAPPPAAKEDHPVITNPDPPIAAPDAIPASTEVQASDRHESDSTQASKPALKVHPDRLKAVADPRDDFAEPGKQSLLIPRARSYDRFPHNPEPPAFEAPVMAITSTNALPLGTFNRFGAPKDDQPSAEKENPALAHKADPSVKPTEEAPAVKDSGDGERRESDVTQAMKPALMVHPDRLNAVRERQEDSPERGKQSFLHIHLSRLLTDLYRCSDGRTSVGYHVDQCAAA